MPRRKRPAAMVGTNARLEWLIDGQDHLVDMLDQLRAELLRANRCLAHIDVKADVLLKRVRPRPKR